MSWSRWGTNTPLRRISLTARLHISTLVTERSRECLAIQTITRMLLTTANNKTRPTKTMKTATSVSISTKLTMHNKIITDKINFLSVLILPRGSYQVKLYPVIFPLGHRIIKPHAHNHSMLWFLNVSAKHMNQITMPTAKFNPWTFYIY